MQRFTPKRSQRTCFLRLGLTLALLAWLLAGFAPINANAAVFIVTSASNSGPGSLRQALEDAGSGDTITFDDSLSGNTIVLNMPLIVNKNVTIDGSMLASPISISGVSAVQVMQVSSGITVGLNSLWIVHGSGATGAGISNAGSLTLTNCTISGNNASSFGGGIFNNGTLLIINSTITTNEASFFGGGIYNNGTLTITNSTISANTAASTSGGIYNQTGKTITITGSTILSNSANWNGAIFNGGTLAVIDSTFADNRTPGNGGGIENQGTLTVTNSTFIANAGNWGGAISNSNDMTVTNSTFSANQASSHGGAIYHASGMLNMSNTILANSTSGGDCYAADPEKIGTNSHNLVESSTGCGTPALSVDPLLGPLADNGGPTQTFALLPGSAAFNAGANCQPADQRGVLRPQWAACDIGAYEQEQPAAVTLPAADVTTDGATLNGTVNPYNFPTTITFEYGLTSSYGESAAGTPGTVSGATSTAVSSVLSGLEPDSTYHYRVVAANSFGITHGDDQTFTTLRSDFNVYLPLILH